MITFWDAELGNMALERNSRLHKQKDNKMKTRLITLLACAIMAQEVVGDGEIIITTKTGDVIRTNLSRMNWNRYDIGRHDGVVRMGHKDIKLPIVHPQRSRDIGVVEIDVIGNLLTNFTVPPGMVSLNTVKLYGNPKLETVFLQQCTASAKSTIEPRASLRGEGMKYITLWLGNPPHSGVDEMVNLKRISAPLWMKGGIHLRGISWKQLHDIEWDWRDNKIEIVRWHHYGKYVSVLCWGTGYIQFAKTINGGWSDYFFDADTYFQYRTAQRYPITDIPIPGKRFFRIKPEPTLGDIPSVVIDE